MDADSLSFIESLEESDTSAQFLRSVCWLQIKASKEKLEMELSDTRKTLEQVHISSVSHGCHFLEDTKFILVRLFQDCF